MIDDLDGDLPDYGASGNGRLVVRYSGAHAASWMPAPCARYRLTDRLQRVEVEKLPRGSGKSGRELNVGLTVTNAYA